MYTQRKTPCVHKLREQHLSVRTTKSDIQIQCNPIQLPIILFTETKENNLKILMESQNIADNQRTKMEDGTRMQASHYGISKDTTNDRKQNIMILAGERNLTLIPHIFFIYKNQIWHRNFNSERLPHIVQSQGSHFFGDTSAMGPNYVMQGRLLQTEDISNDLR